MNVSEEIKKVNWNDIRLTIKKTSNADVLHALSSENKRFADFLALLSPSAGNHLEDMAQIAHHITVQRFGKNIQMYAPIYVSSECSNACVYCGFNRNNRIDRTTLSVEDVIREGENLHEQGFRHVLLVSGESPRHVSVEYFSQIVQHLKPLFASISIEVYPMDADSYATLIKSGVDGLTVYQETYNPDQYQQVHQAGKKKDFNWRLDTPDRGGHSGFRRINIGVLLGLSDWRTDVAFTGLHASCLVKKYWKSHICVSSPRLQSAEGGYTPEFPVKDAELVQLICALRIWLPDAGIVLSTREPKTLRDNLLPLGITQMSAGSKTAPGGYTLKYKADSQFNISDTRTPEEVAHMIESHGYEPVWKDWDEAFF
jgi:2-iminoacetate synthase